jgi:hypothetical protein|tara:strand:- start:1891 stop:2160 length:270 start_codon:yes stop_codon:yes gene_type:complete
VTDRASITNLVIKKKLVIDTKELAEYIYNQVQEHYGQYFSNTQYPYPAILEVPTVDDFKFWIQQFKVRGCIGHNEWNDMYKINLWVNDN